MTRPSRRSAWIAGLVVGVTAGFLTLEFPTLGWLLVVAFLVGGFVWRRPAAATGGLLTGVGLAWVALLGRVALTCRATGVELGCQAPGIEDWLAVGVGLLGAGIAISALAFLVSKRSP
jgi:hypothetical protein